MSAFDLLSQPWLPCRSRDGQPVELGLRDLLRQADELDDLACASPLTYCALLRLLVALLHAALGDEVTNTARARWYTDGWDQGGLDAYLDRWADRFDLFSSERPFLQDAGFELPAADTIARLAPELASGNNVTLFDHTLDDEPPAMDAAQAARWLLTHQLLGLGGGKGPTSNRGQHEYASHAPATYGVSVFLRGANLRETLLLNLAPPREPGAKALGRPLWERDFPQPGPRAVDGLLDRLTWPNRCVRLLPEEREGRVVVARAYTAQGSVFPSDSAVRDPFHARRALPKTGGSMPLKLSGDRALWRDSGALFAFAGEDEARGDIGQDERPWVLHQAATLVEYAPTAPQGWPCVAAGMDSNQSKISLWRVETLPAPPALLVEATGRALLDRLADAVSMAEEVRNALNAAVRGLAQRLLKPGSDLPGAKDKADPKQVAALVDNWRAEALYWSRLDEPFRALMTRLATDDRDQALACWREALVAAADAGYEAAASAAGQSPRALRAGVRARQSVTRQWSFPPKKTQGGN